MTTQHTTETAQVAADTGELVEKVASANDPGMGSLTQIGKSVAAVKIGTRLLPAVWRFVKRHPVSGPMMIVALIGMAYWIRSERDLAPPRA